MLGGISLFGGLLCKPRLTQALSRLWDLPVHDTHFPQGDLVEVALGPGVQHPGKWEGKWRGKARKLDVFKALKS